MAISGSFTLKVTGSQLDTAATRFGTSATNVRNITNQMMTIVNGTFSTWSGNAASTYKKKFSGLQDDMTRMYKMCDEHCSDLKLIAKNYTNAESINQSNFSNLNDNPVT